MKHKIPGNFILLLGLAMGLAVAFSLHHVLREREQEATTAQIESVARERVELLSSTTERSLEALHALAVYVSLASPSRVEFQKFASASRRRLPEVQAFEWIPRVSRLERQHWERAARADGIVGFGFTEKRHGRRPALGCAPQLVLSETLKRRRQILTVGARRPGKLSLANPPSADKVARSSYERAPRARSATPSA